MSPEAGLERPRVLLLAGEVRDAYRRALEEAGYAVRSPGWLDAVPAARLDPPDVVLVSADLPANAPQLVTTAFRAGDLNAIPVAIAGLPPDVAERESAHPLRADRYILPPVTAEMLVHEVAEAVRIGRVRWKRPREQVVVLGVIGLGFLVLGVRALWDGIAHLAGLPAFPGRVDRWLLATGIGAVVAAVAIGIATRRRAFTVRQRRTATGWGALLPIWIGNLVGHDGPPTLTFWTFSLACLFGAEWARLGLRAEPRPSRGWRQWYVALIAVLLALGAAPWIALALLRAG